jgi:hypothetical protein
MKIAKIVHLLLGFLLASFSASAEFINFANPGSPVSLNAYIHINGSPTNYITGTNPGLLSDSDHIDFSGDSEVNVLLAIYDDGFKSVIPALIAQASFSIFNSTGSTLNIEAGALQIGVTGLYALGDDQLSPDFNFDYVRIGDENPDGVTLASSYDHLTGSFYFTNLTALSIPNLSGLVVDGTFNSVAVPEPGTLGCVLFSGLALVVGLIRRQNRLQ